MRRLILTAALTLFSFAANAACPGDPSTCGNPMMTETSGSVMYATAFGVKADGVTSDDLALKAAADACIAKGGKLILPPGKILLTGAASISLRNCGWVGANAPFGGVPGVNAGTTFFLTSTTVKPFVCADGWSMEGFNFYYPNQTTGAVVYPPTISDGGGGMGCLFFRFTNNNIINAYDGIAQTPGTGWGDGYIANNSMFAVHDIIRLSSTPDGIVLTGNRHVPGAWQRYCNSAPACMAAIATATANNTLLRVANNGAGNGIVSVTMSNGQSYGLRYGVRVDSGANLVGSRFDAGWDGVGTLLEVATGGVLSFGSVIFSGSMTACGTVVTPGGALTGNAPCFNVGNNGLVLRNFVSGGGRGSFIVGAGPFYISDVQVDSVGSAADGGDYYLVNMTSGAELNVRGMRAVGRSGDVKVHGIRSTAAGLAMTIEDNLFVRFEKALDVVAPTGASIKNNTSFETSGVKSVAISAANGIFYGDNFWDKPALAVVSACGTGASMTGATSGYITVGSTTPTTSCTITLPFPIPGNYATCAVANGSAGVAAFSLAAFTNTALVSVITSSADMHGAVLYYDCKGVR
jgi:hypothetical protein